MPLPFVGRAAELAELLAALDDAFAGRGALLLLRGEPGIGKTRLAEELAARAEARGARAAWGRCWEGEGAPAYWPWVQILRAAPFGPLPGDAPLAGLIPSGDEPQGARFALFDAVVRRIHRAAADAPLVLVLDDLQWADLPSLLLLKLLARDLHRARLLVIGTARDAEARAQPEVQRLLAEIAREGHVRPLGGLGVDELARLAGRDAGDALVTRLHRATGGNPFFADEVLRLVAAAPATAGAAFPVPDGVREALHRRFDLLPAGARSILAAAALLGRPFDPGLLAAIAGAPPAAVADALAAAAAAGLLRPLPDGEHAFAHDLVRETLAADLPAAERAQLHLRAGDALARAAHSDERAAEIAHHLLAALPAGDPALAADFAARAGRRAAALFAFEDAIAHFRRALDARERLPDARPAVETLLDLAAAQMHAGQVRTAQESCRRAAERAAALGAADLSARAALGYGAEIAFGQVDPYHVALLERALDAVGASDDALRARLLARLASALQPSPTPEVPIARARDAIALARRLGDPATLLAVLAGARAAFRVLDDLDERIALDAETIALAEARGDLTVAQQAHRRQSLNQLERGDLAAADLHDAHYRRLCEQAPRAVSAVQLLQLRACRSAMAGRFDEAYALVDEAEATWRRLCEPFAPTNLPVSPMQLQRLAFERARGRRPALEALLTVTAGPIAAVIETDLLLRLGRREEGRAAYLRAVGPGLPDNTHFFARTYLPDACATLGDTSRAERFLELLSPLTGRAVVWVGAVSACEGAAARLFGRLTGLLGRFDEAERHFAAAVRMNEQLGALPWLAYTWLHHAEVLERRDARGDAARSRELRARAGETFAALGMAGSSPAPVTQPIATPHDFVPPALLREGDYWTLSGAFAPIRLKDSDGLRYLDHLLRHPGVEFHAADLLALRAGAEAPPDESDAGPLLDPQAKAAYRRRLADLREALAEAESHHDPTRAERARAEIEQLTAELSRAVGLSGRDRKAASTAERARVNVTLRIRSALKKIEEFSPAAAHDLTTCIHTGIFCSYTPAPPRR
jgi:tetratricopeptide (TPR) repeat protein